MEELDAIIAQMTSDGRTEAEKATVVKEWKKRNPDKVSGMGKLTGPASATPIGGSNVMESGSVIGSSVLQKQPSQRQIQNEKRRNIDSDFVDDFDYEGFETHLTNVSLRMKSEGKSETDIRDSINKIREANSLEARRSKADSWFAKGMKKIVSWQPDWFVGWSTQIANRTTQMGEDVVRSFESETIAQGLRDGKTMEEMQEAGQITDLRAFDIVQKELNKFAFKQYDANGNEMNVVDLIEAGRVGDAGTLAAEQAVSNIYSFLATTVNPVAGAGVIATSAYGSTFMDNIQNRYDPTTMTDEDLDNLRKNAYWHAGGEFIGEYLGGRFFRGVTGIGKKATSEAVFTQAVKEYGRGFMNRTARGFLGGFGAEFFAEGLTNFVGQKADKEIFGDEKTFRDYFRGFINDGLIGGLLGGPIGGGMRGANKITKQNLYDMVTSKEHQQELLKNNIAIQRAEEEAKNSTGRTKEIYKKRIEILKKQRDALNRKNSSIFDGKTQTELEAWAGDMDEVNKQFDIYTDETKSPETRKAAKDRIQELYKKQNEDTKGFVNETVEFELGKIFKYHEILNKRKGIGKFFQPRDLKIKYLDNQEQVDKAIKESGVDEIQGADGMFLDGKTKTIYINRERAMETGTMNVIGHELLHYVFSKNFKTDNESMKPLVDEFKKYLVESGNGAVLARIEQKMKANGYFDKDGEIKEDMLEEYFQHFSNLIDKGEIKLQEEKAKPLAKRFKDYKVSLGFGSVQLDTGKDVFDFIRLYNKNIYRKGLLGKVTQTAMVKAKLESSLVAKADKPSSKIMPSKSTDAINELGQMGWDNKSWEEQGADFVIEEMKNNRMLDGLIRSKYKADVVPPNFVDLVYSELVSHVKNFKPEQNDNLFGWINSQIANKAGNVYNREFKVADEMKGAKDIGKTTKEGEVKVQVAADTDVAMEALETEDLSPAAQAKKKADKAKAKETVESEFRKEVGIETDSDIYNKVLETARKTLLRAYEAGTPVRNVQRKLRNEANVYLFKTVKNLLGTKAYISNLKNFREPIMKVMFTSDLVQMERNVPDNERVFTKFVKKLTSKEEVQDAVDQKLLPPEALNVIDKGTAVNLYEKANPTEKQFLSFFDIPAINPKTGARSGKRGTRKDQLAKYMAGALTYDATMEVAQEPEVMQKRADLAELNGESLAKDNLETLAAAISRDPKVKFSKSNAEKGVDILEGNNKDDGYGGKNWQKYMDNTKISDRTKYEVLDEYLKRNTEQNDAISKKELAKLDRFKNGNKRKTKIPVYKKYEIIAKQRAEKLLKDLKLDKEGYTVESLSEKDNNPDIRITKNGKTVLAIEIKGNTARGVSISFNYKKDGKGLTKGKRAAEKQETENYNKQEESLIKDSNKVFDKMIAFVGKGETQYSTQNNLQISVEGVKKIKDQGLHLEIYKNKYFITPGDVSNSYAQKKGKDGGSKTSHVIEMGNAGMYSMDNTADLVIDGLKNFSDQKALIPITARINFGRVNKAGTHRTASIRVEPQLNSLFFEKQDISLINKSSNKNIKFKFSMSKKESVNEDIIKAAIKSRSTANFSKSKGASVFDFDETVGISENFIIAKKGNITEKIPSYEWPLVGETLKEQGYEFDFTDFNKVTKGKPGPLLQKMKNQIEKYGSKNVFILTARAPESQAAIHEWLESEGVNIPIDNITGLGNSTGEAKAAWILDKYANKGYNDIYFVDDALQNVKAVQNMLDQLDVKGKSVQAKVKFSKNMSDNFNKILETTKGVPAKDIISRVRAIERGSKKGRYKFFLPPSAEDFKGLLYYFMGKGRQGDKDAAFLKKALIDPLNRAYTEFNSAKQVITNEYRALKKSMPEAAKKVNKTTPDADFTYGDAVRVYLWNKAGFDVPGLNKKDIDNLVEMVTSDPQLMMYAYKIGKISRQNEGYTKPGEYWKVGDIRNDLDDVINKVGRKQHFDEFVENTEVIFGKMVNGKLTGDNINKIEAIYGTNFREALEDILYRTINGRSRPYGSNRLVNSFTNWVNGSVGAVMFVNMRSALLQQMSTVNFINYGDNNIFKAAVRLADQKQFWKDWVMIFNSDKLKQRRAGLTMDINANELTTYLSKSKSKTKAAINWLLRQGFKPTQISDSVAIANGGATFYRNRVNTYLKQGLSKKEAEAKAWNDFSEIAEETQQSARPDMASPQQASAIGKWFLNFLNTPMQYSRIIKKSMLDLINRRRVPNLTQTQSDTTNISRILYYGFAQNVIFYTLQTGLFAALFDDEDDEESKKFFDKRYQMTANSIVDGLLRGLGFGGAAISTLKNMIVKFVEEDKKGYTGRPVEKVTLEMVNLSPVVGIKVRKVATELRSYGYDKDVIKHMETFDIDNPIWGITTGITEGLTNIPVNRLHRKITNLRAATQDDIEAWQRLALISGWSVWNLGMQNKELERIKVELKEERKKLKKKKKKKTSPRFKIKGL